MRGIPPSTATHECYTLGCESKPGRPVCFLNFPFLKELEKNTDRSSCQLRLAGHVHCEARQRALISNRHSATRDAGVDTRVACRAPVKRRARAFRKG